MTVRRKFPETDRHIGERVRYLRNRRGLSQQKLAGLIEITFQQLQKYENGDNRISASTLFEIAKALRVDVSYFYQGLKKRTSAPVPPMTKQHHKILYLYDSTPENVRRSFISTMEGFVRIHTQ